MKKILQLKLKQQFAIFFGFILSATFLVVAVSVYYLQKNMLQERAHSRMEGNLNAFYNILDLQHKEKQEALNRAFNIAHHLFYTSGTLEQSEEEVVEFNAVDQISKESKTVKVPLWTINGEPLQNNFVLVDEIRRLAGGTATIFQKIEGGYLRISTNVLKEDGARAMGTYIPNSSPVVQTIEKNQTYTGRAFVVNDWYTSVYEPIVLDGKVQGMLYVGVKEKDMQYLKEIVLSEKIMGSGYTFILDAEGKAVIHPSLEGKDLKGSELGKHLLENKTGLYHTSKDEQDKPEDNSSVYFKYFEPYNFVIAVKVSDNDLYLYALSDLRNTLIFIFLVALGVTYFLIQLIVGQITNPILYAVNTLVTLAKGEKADKLKVEHSNEIGEMNRSLNLMIDSYANYSIFAERIGEGKFDAQFQVASEGDILGNALLQMRDNLKENKENENKRNWITEGLAQFGDILQTQYSDFNVFADRVISSLVKYLHANQGGLFIAKEESVGEFHLELTACYAYNRKKFIQKRIEIGEGLIGQAYLEKDIIYMTDLPDDYMQITSGLGGANPGCLLIVPLKANDQIEGVIELASFHPFEQHEIELVQKLSDNIAAMLSSIKINERTRLLLESTQQQAEELRATEEEIRQNMEEMEATQEEMRRKQEEVIALKTQTDTLLSNVQGVIALHRNDAGRTLEFMSEGVLGLTGYKASDFLYKEISLEALVHPEEQARIRQEFNANAERVLRAGGSFEMSYRIVSKQGEVKNVFLKGVGVVDNKGQISHLENIIVDVTQLIAAKA